MSETISPTTGRSLTAMERAERIFRRYILPATIKFIVYSIGLFWSLVVVYRTVRRFYHDPSKFLSYKKRPLPPKVLNDPALGNHCYINLPNVKLHYVESGDKSKPLMLLLHGFPEFWYSWRHQIKEFSKDHWVVAADMRGYGDSDKPASIKYYKKKYLVDDLRNLILGLGKEKAIVVAHDWGGFIAWDFILQYPEMIEKFVILNAPHPKAFRKMLMTFSQFLKSWYVFFFQLPFLPELWIMADDLASFRVFFKNKKGLVLNDEELEAYKYTYGKSGAFYGPLAYYRALYNSDKPPKKSDAAASVEPPKGLMIFGEDDVAIDVKTVSLSKKMYPNLTTEIIVGACHFVQQDEPTIVNAKMREFLSS